MTEVEALSTLSTSALQSQYRTLFGEPTASRNRAGLIRRIAWRMQERTFGGLSERAQRRAAELADDAELRILPPRTKERPTVGSTDPKSARRDPRLPAVGTVLRRVYRGVSHVVAVGDTDFEYGGERFDSLSAVAKRITGTHLNGFRFFGLGMRGDR